MAGRGRGIAFLKSLKKSANEQAEASPAEEIQNLQLTDESNLLDEAAGGEPALSDSAQGSSLSTKGTGIPLFLTIGRGRGRGRVASLGAPSTAPSSSEEGSAPSAEKSSLSKSDKNLQLVLAAGRGRGSAPKSSNSSSKDSSALTAFSSTIPPAEKKYGEKGTRINAVCNCIFIECDPNKGVFEYEVLFNPSVDSVDILRKCVSQGKHLFGETRSFDGKILRLPQKLPDDLTRFQATTEAGDVINVTIKFQKQVRLGNCLSLYNLLMDHVFRTLKYVRDGKKMYNPDKPPIIPAHRLELWPGYVKSVNELHGGLMLTLDVSHKVLTTTTVYDKIREVQRSSAQWKDDLRKHLVSRIVTTKYTNKCYRIDDFCFDRSPETTFEFRGAEIKIKDYYKQQYNIDVRDNKQPMIVCHKQIRIEGTREKAEQEILLIPELCNLTGLSDEQKRDFKVMKDVATYTKMSPAQRIGAYKSFVDNVYNSEKALSILSGWGLKLQRDMTHIPVRVLDEQKIIFGGNKEFSAGMKGDFTRYATSNEVIHAVDINEWIIFVSKGSEKCASLFESKAIELSKPTGMRVKKARIIVIADDKTSTYCQAIREALHKTKTVQIVVVIFPSLRDDRYAAVKQILTVEIPTPSQVIQTRNLRDGDNKKLNSIALKILLQMNCKLGGALWGMKIPLKDTMIVGIDTYHEIGSHSINVAGFVASMDKGFMKYYSNPTVQAKKEELVSGLTHSMEMALNKFYEENGKVYPATIIMYRDGVSEGQLEPTLNFEIAQFRAAFTRIDIHYKPKLTFVVVQKRVNSKFYKEIDALQMKYENLPPGSVIDTVATSKKFYDYYVVSQYVTQGATTPSHYVCLLDENDFKADILQLLTYKLCFMYYNWMGTVRVPGPCQYAHKLAEFIGKNIRGPVPETLRDKLFFL